MKRIIISIIIFLGLGVASGYFTQTDGWFETIHKPSWNPPNWIFGPVWTILYILMGIAFGIIWNSDHRYKRIAILIFGIQFIVNLSWSYVFFNQHLLLIAFLEIIFMIICTTISVFLFYKINRIASFLIIPYLMWICFASYLNYTISIMN